MIICYATCWGCKFDDHPGGPHTWMDSDDIGYSGIQAPETPEDRAQLATDQPCGCPCVTEKQMTPDDDDYCPEDDNHEHALEYDYSVYHCTRCGEVIED